MTISGASKSSSRVKLAGQPLRRSVALVCLGAVLLFARPGGHVQAASQGDLRFFKNYFLTGGNSAVGGVGLLGLGDSTGYATGTIHMSGVPANAEIVAAFLYWISMESATDPSSANGFFRGFPIKGRQIAAAGTASCWGSGGGQGTTSGASALRVYRADVLRQLPALDKILVNDADLAANNLPGHQVSLADSGGGGSQSPSSSNQATHTEGASLLVVYRIPTAPLRAVVIYDGGLTANTDFPTMSLTLKGFYQASPTPGAKLTHIVGDGDSSKQETLSINNSVVPDANPFRGAQGSAWDNPTFNVPVVSGDEVTTKVVPTGSAMDCLSWGAVVFSTEVKDTDGDGLLDIWETSSTLVDPNGQPLPNLGGMGADPNQKDVFVEIGYMFADGTTYGGVSKPAHDHMLPKEALDKVGDAFLHGPVPIHVHFDVGNRYQSPSDPYIIPAGLARGGESIDETITVCTRAEADPPWVCQYGDHIEGSVTVHSAYPGTVGWKTGFKFLRDQFLNTPPPLTAEGDDPCDAPGNDGSGQVCERRFDRNRKDMFHYILAAHSLGLPKAACLNEDGTPDTVCQQTNPDFHVPRTNSGIDDFPGADGMLTLGAFPDASGKPVGTPFMQGATLMHEMGHSFELTHAGTPVAPPLPREPNCKPNYLSIMNYLFQLRGLFNDDPVNAGVPLMDYSREGIAGILSGGTDEGNLFDARWFSVTPTYRTGWYAPQGIGSAAKKHCDGSPLLKDANGDFTEPPMFRVDSPSVAGPYDWKGDGFADATTQPQDLNFDGIKTLLNPAPNDWATFRLNQIGNRRNVGGFFVDAAGKLLLGPLSLDVGRGDVGRGDVGRGDVGRGDVGRGDVGRGDVGRGDVGRGDVGYALGRGDVGRGDVGEPADEVDSDIASASGNTPPNTLRAGIVGGSGPSCVPEGFSSAACHRIELKWKAPNVGAVDKFLVKRFKTNDPNNPAWIKTLEKSAESGVVDYSLIDTQELPNAQFTYYVQAQFVAGDPAILAPVSGPSNFVTILAVNTPPTANADSYTTIQGTPLTVSTCPSGNLPGKGSGVLCNDTDVDSPALTGPLVTAAYVPGSGPSSGTLVVFNQDGSFTYTPTASFTGTVFFKYVAKDVDTTRTSNQATVTITVTKKSGK